MKKILLITIFAMSSVARAASEDKFNFHFAPASLLLGGLGVGFDHKLNEKFVVGFNVSTYRSALFGTEYKNSGASIFTDYFFREAFSSGPYLTAIAGQTNAELSYSENGKTYSASRSGTYAAVGGGYHWFWSSFNMKLGVALGTNPLGTIEVKNDNQTVIKSQDPTYTKYIFEFDLGFTF